MQHDEGSIAAFASLLPFADATDLSERMTRLAQSLRDAPMTHEGNDLFDKAAAALAALPADPISVDRVMCLLFIARHNIFGGNAYAGLGPATHAVAMSGRLGDTRLQAKALKVLGLVYLEGGSYPDTVSAFSAALQAARAAGDTAQEADVLSNLGLAHQYAGHYSEAVPCYERAVELADDEAGAVIRTAALSNLALACLHLRDFAAGIAAAERAIECLQDPVSSHDRMVRTMVECYYARLLMEVRNLPRARERIAKARGYAAGATTLAQLLADMTLGLAEVHDPVSRDIGLSRLQKAVNESRRGVPSALRDALAMIVRGYEVAGQPNAALVYLHEVVQLNGDRRVRSVLNQHRRHLAKVSRRHLDRRAEVVLEQQKQELRFQRLSMDELRECMQVLEKNTVAAELHDDETGEHCYRVGALAKELARRRGMDDEMCTLIDLSARLHDIGKLRVPDAILLKPGALTSDERAIMARHCEQGWELIGEGGLKQLFVAQEIALNHHERWDGSGYPNRRQGNMIPLAARVAALADVFDALTHRRSYKHAWTVEEALREIASLRGRHFDPELTDLFLELVPQLQSRYPDLDAYLGAEARRNDFIVDRARVSRELKRGMESFDLRR